MGHQLQTITVASKTKAGQGWEGRDGDLGGETAASEDDRTRLIVIFIVIIIICVCARVCVFLYNSN